MSDGEDKEEHDQKLSIDADRNESEIQGLLDLGYDQLDGFVRWLEESEGESTRTAQQHCFNAESLIDFLANQHRKPVEGMNEFELRWFVFSHYIRTTVADEETSRRLFDSLRLFLNYIAHTGIDVLHPWTTAVLIDADDYFSRRSAYLALNEVSEAEWESGFRQWNAELEEDLDARSLWLPREIGDGMVWSSGMGWYEAALYDEANRNWQVGRDELLHSGLSFDDIRDRLTRDYSVWVDMPQARLDDETPREAITRERIDNAEEEDAEEEDAEE